MNTRTFQFLVWTLSLSDKLRMLLFLPNGQMEDHSTDNHRVRAVRKRLGEEQVRYHILLKSSQEEVEHVAEHKPETENSYLCR